MISLKKYHIFSIKHIWYAAFLLLFVLLLTVFFFIRSEQSSAAWIQLTGLSPGAPCPAPTSEWFAVRGDLRDAPTGNQINGTFTAQCKYDFRASVATVNQGCLDNVPGGHFYCEGPDAVHPGFSWATNRCAGGNAGLMGIVCIGGCSMPFNLNADAVNYSPTPVWLVNHGANSTQTLYPEGNANIANYNIYLDRAACETYSWNACSGNTAVALDPWGNWCATSACAGNSKYCSGNQVCNTNQGCSGGACVNNPDTCGPDPCTGWTNQGCGIGGCSAAQMYQTRDCTYNCAPESQCVASAACGGTILGRVFVDSNADGKYETGERLVQNGVSCGTPLSLTLGGVSIKYNGPVSGSRNPNFCNPDPYYSTGLLPLGNYSVSVNPPAGWTATTPTQNANLTGGNLEHRWFGITQKPIAEASAAKTIAGPWSDKVYITNVNPDVDKSKNWDFVLSALEDITGDGLASRDPKGGPITCTWAYDIDHVATTTFTGCELGDGEYTDAKRQEMVDYYKAKPEGTYGAMLTVTDQYGFQDTDTVTIFKDPPPPPPKVDSFSVDDQCGTGADLGIPKNVITWSASGTTSYELKACIETDCTTIDSGPFIKNPNTFTHIAEDGVYYVYMIIVHGPGGDSSSSTMIQARNCKGAISLTVYLVDSAGKIFIPIPEATVKLTNTAGTSVLATTTTDDYGMAHFKKLIPGTYGVLAYKNKYKGIAKQAGDCESAQYSTVNASIGPNAATEWIQAAWDNNVPVIEARTTWCHDLGLEGIPPLKATCSASPDPAEVNTPVAWTAEVAGGEKTGKTYSYSWTGDDGLSGTGKTITKTYTTTGLKTALTTITSDKEKSTEMCAVNVIPPVVCDPNEFPKNQFARCLYDYNFDTSPSSSTISNGKLLSVVYETALSTIFNELSSLVAIDNWWRGTIIPSLGKSDDVGGTWQATINFKAEEYKFIVDSDDGLELTVDLDGDGSLADEAPIINEWHKFDSEVNGHYETAGYYSLSGYRKVRVRWFEDTGEAKIKLTWYNKTCHMLGLQDKLHVCFYKGTSPGSGEFIGERDEALFNSPAAIFHNPIDNRYSFGGESGIVDNFSGIWRGVVNFAPGMYKFRIETNEGVRLDIDEDGIYEIDEWHDHEGVHETVLTPVGGNTPIRIEWYEKTGEAQLFFTWQKQISLNPLNAFKRLFASLSSFFYGIIS